MDKIETVTVRDDSLERRLEGRGLGEGRAGGVGLSVGGHVVDVSGLRREAVGLRYRTVGPARGLGPAGHRREDEQEQEEAATEEGLTPGDVQGLRVHVGSFQRFEVGDRRADGTTRASPFASGWDILRRELRR